MKKYLKKWRSGLIFVLLGLFLTMTLTGLMAKVSPAIRERSRFPHHDKAVNLKIEGNYRVIESNGIPDHATGQFPNSGNPNAISPQNYTFRVPLNPRRNERWIASRGMFFGVAINGIPFEPGTAEYWTTSGRRTGGREARNAAWNYEALSGKINLGMDRNNAHVQPGGVYHYHGLPKGLLANLGSQAVQLIGYAADGFPIYGVNGYRDNDNPRERPDAQKPEPMRSSYRLKSGTRSGGPGGPYDGTFTQDYEYVAGLGDLDECNGGFGITPEYPQGIYHYHITEEFPFISRCFRGIPDNSFRKGPPRRRGNSDRQRRDRPFPPPRSRPSSPPLR
jgi:hypothetical protein